MCLVFRNLRFFGYKSLIYKIQNKLNTVSYEEEDEISVWREKQQKNKSNVIS